MARTLKSRVKFATEPIAGEPMPGIDWQPIGDVGNVRFNFDDPVKRANCQAQDQMYIGDSIDIPEHLQKKNGLHPILIEGKWYWQWKEFA